MRQALSSVSVGSIFGTGEGPPLLRRRVGQAADLRHGEVEGYEGDGQQQEGGRAVERLTDLHGLAGTGAREGRVPQLGLREVRTA